MLKVPKTWAVSFDEIAKREDPLKSWSSKAREVLKDFLELQKVMKDTGQAPEAVPVEG